MFRKFISLLIKSKIITTSEIYDDLIKMLNSNDFKNNLTETEVKKDFSCLRCYKCLEKVINRFYKNNNDFLFAVYQYALSKSFNEAVTLELCKDDFPIYETFLILLKVFCEFQKFSKDSSFQSRYPLLFLNDDEKMQLEDPSEYIKFIEAFEDEYIYEMMKLNQEIIGFNTLDHVCGVHYLSLYIARQVNHKNIPIDLGRISGAAAGHDIGKFGCKGLELKRVPYLHYYYTDVWFKKHNINYIRNIAINHSTWDLELENLPIESLILIYSDFRVKNKKINNKECMYIYTIDESFEVILNKLDNVDEKKLTRYKKVYSKLKDFENYLINIGIDTYFLNRNQNNYSKSKCYSLMFGDEIIENIKYQSINHNIHLMYKLRNEFSLNKILENARNVQNSQSLRIYLDIIQEYSTYLTQKQKIITLSFLYEQLTHNEEDIRRQSAELLGLITASFDEDYRKEIPIDAKLEPHETTSLTLFKKYIGLILNLDPKLTDTLKDWIGYSLSIFINSFFKNIKNNQFEAYKETIKSFYNKNKLTKEIELYLLDAVKYIPLDDKDETIFSFILTSLKSPKHHIRIMALDTLLYQMNKTMLPNSSSSRLNHLFMKDLLFNATFSENYLKLKIAKMLTLNENLLNYYNENYNKTLDEINLIFLSNLKTATSWITKKVQIDILLDYAFKNINERGLQVALHFCNLLKVSAVEAVRNKAGKSILEIIKYLPMHQRNEIAIELVRALEMEEYRFTKYIPNYLGKIILYLSPVELKEFLEDSYYKIKTSNIKTASLILKTASMALSNIDLYKNQFLDNKNNIYDIKNKLISIIINGLANYNNQIKQFASMCIGRYIFGSSELSLDEKTNIFKLIAKKYLCLLENAKEDELLFLVNSASLNHIYRFISEQNIISKITLEKPSKIAFMPGTFDPFSLGHKEIAKTITSMGFEVYIAIDEFSWSKKPLPNLIRRNIVNMSIADEHSIYLFPEVYPINIANNNDIKRLKNIFNGFDLFIVVGSDVVINASAYQKTKDINSIHSLNHIIFERISGNQINIEKLKENIEKIDGEIIKLNLPPQFEDISSTQIRNSIDENRDISNLVDPLVEKYIYENGFYRHEPQYKTIINKSKIDFVIFEEYNQNLIKKISRILSIDFDILNSKFMSFFSKPSARIMLAIDDSNQNIIGFCAFHWLRSTSFYNELNDNIISNYLRENAVGRIVLIDLIYVNKNHYAYDISQILLTEVLTFCIQKDYDYAIYKNTFDINENINIDTLFTLNGFVFVNSQSLSTKCYAVNMSYPIVLLLLIETIIKEPYKNMPKVQKAIKETRHKLQIALSNLYKGNVVLTFERDVLYNKLIEKICSENNVPTKTLNPRRLGPFMCVPYGNILKRNVIPNTITKAIHTEKIFNSDLKSFTIGPYPNYLSLDMQIKTIASFDKPVILVDDILHKGYRIQAIDPILKQENINVKKIIVAILSGKGKEIMDIQNRKVDSAYFIPKLRAWFYEDALYPFIGGDTVNKQLDTQKNIVPSINLILPYGVPTFLKGVKTKDIFNFSKVCIENAIKIIEALEEEYQNINERSLSLKNIGDVFIYPRFVDIGDFVYYDLNLSPSIYLKNDLKKLEKLMPLLNKEDNNERI